MTTEEYIKDFNGVIIGIVETKDNGDQLVREFSTRRILGYYIKDRNHTTDFMGRILRICHKINQAVGLIM